MDSSPKSPLLTVPASEWLLTIMTPVKHCFIPISYKEKSSKAALDPGCHSAMALIVKFDHSTNFHIYQIVGFHRVDDPSSYDIRADNLMVKHLSGSKCKFKGTLDGNKPLKITFKHDWKHESHCGHITIKWLVNEVPDHLHIDDARLPHLLQMAQSN